MRHFYSKTRQYLARLSKPVTPVLANLGAIPLTIAGMACVSAGIFIICVPAGLIISGVLLFLLEHLIADE